MRTDSLDAILYRRVSRTRQPLSTEGSRTNGGRYNHPGVPALYLACSPDIARLEFEKHSRKVGLAVSKPGMTVSVEAHLERVLDLTSPEVRSELGVSLEDLCGESPHRTRSIGDAARLAGYQGIRYPAAVDPTGSNVVVFEENAGEGALQIVARDDDWPQESK